MKKFYGGQTVAQGVYMNTHSAEFTQMYGEVRELPGGRDAGYVKVPGALAALAGPFIGLVFVIFLPLAGIVGILGFAVSRLVRLVSEFGQRAVQPVAVGWRPGRAYLTRKGAPEAKQELTDKEFPDATIAEIETEIARRRSQGEK